MRSFSLRAFLVLLVGLASAPLDADALIPPGYDGIAVHVTFDGSGQTSRTDTGSMPTYVGTTVTGTSHVQSQAGNCDGPITFNPHYLTLVGEP